MEREDHITVVRKIRDGEDKVGPLSILPTDKVVEHSVVLTGTPEEVKHFIGGLGATIFAYVDYLVEIGSDDTPLLKEMVKLKREIARQNIVELGILPESHPSIQPEE